MSTSQSKSFDGIESPKSIDSELERYGVWVKAEPQDILEEPEIEHLPEIGNDAEPSESLETNDLFLSEEEEKLLGSLDEPGTLDSVPEEAFDSSIGEKSIPVSGEAESIDLIDDLTLHHEPMLTIDDRDSGSRDEFDIVVGDMESRSVESSVEELEPLMENSSVIDLPLDDFEDHVPIRRTDSPRTVVSDVKGSSPSTDHTEEFSPADFGLDMDDISGAPATLSTPSNALKTENVDLADFGLGDDSELPADQQQLDDFEPIDIDLDFDDSLPELTSAAGITAEPSSSSEGFETVTDFDDILSDIETPSEDGDREASASAETRKTMAEAPVSIDSFAPMDGKAKMPARPEPASVKTDSPAASAVSSDLLLTIVNELSSIKRELVSLKSQLSSIQGQSASGLEEKTERDEAAAANPAGFFDEEEDETIALTGDELDNILNTANFTEETIEAENLPPEGIPPDALSDIELLPEDGVYRSAPGSSSPAIEEIVFEPENRSGLEDSAAADTGHLSRLVEEGVSPMSLPPEDTSFLDQKEQDEFHLDISDEIPLVEPDLSAMEIEQLPGAEDSEELPAAEDAGDITLDLEHIDSPEEIDLQDVTDAVPEIEFERPGDISIPPIPSAKSAPEELEELAFVDIEEEPSSEIVLHREETGASPIQEMNADLEEPTDVEELLLEESEETAERAIKPSEPVALHPDDIPLNLSDEFFVPGSEKPESPTAVVAAPERSVSKVGGESPDRLKSEIKSVLSYLDTLLESLPENKIEEFANSKYFDTYKKLFEELGLV
ncbi:MAG: hypothetical protein NT080_14715 [Spirochaetes bacterium]|nr:hypothetical protein [Spirochaetota bacterium]